MVTDFELIELLTAKFCHDLSGPIGAVNNGVEFLTGENNEMHERAIELVEVSAKEAVTRLQFFRQLYGTVPSIGEANLASLKNITTNFFATGKISLDWPDAHTDAAGVSINHRMGKILLNLVYFSSTLLIHGGKISVRLQKTPNSKRMKIQCSGNSLKQDPELVKLLQGKAEGISVNSRNVQPFYTGKLAKSAGVKLALEFTEESAEINADIGR